MSVPFAVTFNALGSVPYTGSPQTVYVTSASPVEATFSQVYPGVSTATNIGDQVSLLVKGTGRFAGTTYNASIRVSDSGSGGLKTLDDIIVYSDHQTSNELTFTNTVTVSNIFGTLPSGILDQGLLVDPPPAITFLTPFRSSAGTDIVVPWQIPTRIQTGFYPDPLPLLNKMHFSGLAEYESGTLVTDAANAIVFTTTGSPGEHPVIIDGFAANAYVVSVQEFQGGDLTAWYSNFNPSYHPSTITLESLPGTPSEPFADSYSVMTPRDIFSRKILSVELTYLSPVTQDRANPESNPGLSEYRFHFNASQQANASGSPVRDTRGDVFVPSYPDPQVATFQSIYPDCFYEITISANNLVNSSFGAGNAYSFSSGAAPYPDNLFGPLSFSTAKKYSQDAYRVSNLSLVSGGLLWGNVSTITSDTFEFYVMTSESDRGTLRSPTTVLSNITTTPSGPHLNFYNFDGTDDTYSNSRASSLTKVSTGDYYAGVPGYQGYYKIGAVTANVSLVSSGAQQFFALNNNGVQMSSYFYYWDGIVGVPDVTTNQPMLHVSSNTLVTKYITGVNVIVSTSTFDANVTGALNVGRFVPYTAITYTADGSSFSGRRQGDKVVFTIQNTSFASSVPVTYTVFNMNGGSVPVHDSFLTLIDVASNTTVSSFGTGTIGTLRWLPGVSAQTQTLPGTVALEYDHTQSIVTSYANALQISNGFFTTDVPLINYSLWPSPLNTVDYSGIAHTGYRFATFSWNLQNGDTSPTRTFTFNGFSSTFYLNSSSGVSIGSPSGPSLYFAYRYIDETNPANGAFNTQWIQQGFQNVSGNSFTISITRTPNNNTCYLYTVVGLPMGTSLQFRSVQI
jgi:hypothetical protein